MKHRYIFLSSRLRSTDLPSAGLSRPEQDTGLACKKEKEDSIYPSPLPLAAGTAKNFCPKKERKKQGEKKAPTDDPELGGRRPAHQQPWHRPAGPVPAR